MQTFRLFREDVTQNGGLQEESPKLNRTGEGTEVGAHIRVG